MNLPGNPGAEEDSEFLPGPATDTGGRDAAGTGAATPSGGDDDILFAPADTSGGESENKADSSSGKIPLPQNQSPASQAREIQGQTRTQRQTAPAASQALAARRTQEPTASAEQGPASKKAVSDPPGTDSSSGGKKTYVIQPSALNGQMKVASEEPSFAPDRAASDAKEKISVETQGKTSNQSVAVTAFLALCATLAGALVKGRAIVRSLRMEV